MRFGKKCQRRSRGRKGSWDESASGRIGGKVRTMCWTTESDSLAEGWCDRQLVGRAVWRLGGGRCSSHLRPFWRLEC